MLLWGLNYILYLKFLANSQAQVTLNKYSGDIYIYIIIKHWKSTDKITFTVRNEMQWKRIDSKPIVQESITDIHTKYNVEKSIFCFSACRTFKVIFLWIGFCLRVAGQAYISEYFFNLKKNINPHSFCSGRMIYMCIRVCCVFIRYYYFKYFFKWCTFPSLKKEESPHLTSYTYFSIIPSNFPHKI